MRRSHSGSCENQYQNQSVDTDDASSQDCDDETEQFNFPVAGTRRYQGVGLAHFHLYKRRVAAKFQMRITCAVVVKIMIHASSYPDDTISR